jgi:hypothetical protein
MITYDFVHSINHGDLRIENPMTSGVERTTFRLVAEFLNQLLYRVPRRIHIKI